MCESHEGRQSACRDRSAGVVTVHVHRQLGRARCAFNENWGTIDGGVWVDHGCRAVFADRTRGGSRTPHGGTPYDRELPADSRRGEWTHRDVPRVHVARVERIAGNEACSAYEARGVDDTGIWVRNDGQGAFRVRYRHRPRDEPCGQDRRPGEGDVGASGRHARQPRRPRRPARGRVRFPDSAAHPDRL